MHQLDERSSWTESPIRDPTEIDLNPFACRKITSVQDFPSKPLPNATSNSGRTSTHSQAAEFGAPQV